MEGRDASQSKVNSADTDTCGIGVSQYQLISIYQAKTLGQREVELFHQNLIQSKEAALKDTVDVAFDAIIHIYNDTTIEEDVAKARVKAILNHLTYGSDGYFLLTINMALTLSIQHNLI